MKHDRNDPDPNGFNHYYCCGPERENSPQPPRTLDSWLDVRIEDERTRIVNNKLWGRMNTASCHEYAMQAFIEVKRMLEMGYIER